MNSSFSAPDLSSAPSSSSPDDDDNHTLKSKSSSHRDSKTSKIFNELKCHKASLQEKLRKKLEDLKDLCVKEAELTGCMPNDLQRFFKAEDIPQVRRRVGTSFVLSSKLLDNDLSKADELTQLEIEYEVQEKLMTAVFKLAHDKSTTKTIRKKRRQTYQMEQAKLKDLEMKINELRRRGGHGLLPSKSLDDIDDDVEPLMQRKPALYSSLTSSQNEDPDKNSTFSSISNKSSSSSSSLPDQSPASGIKFYPKKKLSDASHCRLHYSNSGSSSRSATPSLRSRDHHLMSPRSKCERRHLSNTSVKSSSRIEGRRRSNHFSKVPVNPPQTPSNGAPTRCITGAGDVTSSAYNTSTNLVGIYTGSHCDTSMVTLGEDPKDSWKFNKYNSLDRRRKSSGVVPEGNWCPGPPRRGSVELMYLTPSKYGSKRDSTLGDDGEDTLGRQYCGGDISNTALHHCSPFSHPYHQFSHENFQMVSHLVDHKGSSDSGSGHSSGLSRVCDDDDTSFLSRASTTSLSFTSSIQQLYNCNSLLQQQKPKVEKYLPPSACGDGGLMNEVSTSSISSSSSSLHFHPHRPHLESEHPNSRPSGPDKLTRVVTDVRMVGPRAAQGVKQVSRDERNEEAVDALFKHYEEKILPSRMVLAKDPLECDDVIRQQRS